MRDEQQRTLKIELLSQWMMEAEFCNYCSANLEYSSLSLRLLLVGQLVGQLRRRWGKDWINSVAHTTLAPRRWKILFQLQSSSMDVFSSMQMYKKLTLGKPASFWNTRIFLTNSQQGRGVTLIQSIRYEWRAILALVGNNRVYGWWGC